MGGFATQMLTQILQRINHLLYVLFFGPRIFALSQTALRTLFRVAVHV